LGLPDLPELPELPGSPELPLFLPVVPCTRIDSHLLFAAELVFTNGEWAEQMAAVLVLSAGSLCSICMVRAHLMPGLVSSLLLVMSRIER